MSEHRTSIVESTPIAIAMGIIAAGVVMGLAVWGIAEVAGINLETGSGDDVSTVGPINVAIASLVVLTPIGSGTFIYQQF